tara:strand:+ start:442 stop:1371 length:930 start_codon:yes stop_codon:yes gene_type:complete
MAKKIKQKKSGMIRRQQKKRQQKKIRRRLSMTSKTNKNLDSSENIEQLLSTLPTLAFEPELLDLKMNESEMKLSIEKGIPEIDIFLKLLTDEFIKNLESKLTHLVELNPEKSVKSILAKATQHQIKNEEKISFISNPFLIAIFLKTKAFVEELDLNQDSIADAIKEFNLRNEQIISNISEKFDTNINNENNKNNQKDFNLPESPKKISPVIEQSVFKKFLERIPKPKQQIIEEDLDVFLEDFQPPPIDEWDINLVKNFMKKWFVENANPMEEDLESMRESLLQLFKFLNKEELITENFLDEVYKFLKNS